MIDLCLEVIDGYSMSLKARLVVVRLLVFGYQLLYTVYPLQQFGVLPLVLLVELLELLLVLPLLDRPEVLIFGVCYLLHQHLVLYLLKVGSQVLDLHSQLVDFAVGAL